MTSQKRQDDYDKLQKAEAKNVFAIYLISGTSYTSILLWKYPL